MCVHGVNSFIWGTNCQMSQTPVYSKICLINLFIRQKFLLLNSLFHLDWIGRNVVYRRLLLKGKHTLCIIYIISLKLYQFVFDLWYVTVSVVGCGTSTHLCAKLNHHLHYVQVSTCWSQRIRELWNYWATFIPVYL